MTDKKTVIARHNKLAIMKHKKIAYNNYLTLNKFYNNPKEIPCIKVDDTKILRDCTQVDDFEDFKNFLKKEKPFLNTFILDSFIRLKGDIVDVGPVLPNDLLVRITDDYLFVVSKNLSTSFLLDLETGLSTTYSEAPIKAQQRYIIKDEQFSLGIINDVMWYCMSAIVVYSRLSHHEKKIIQVEKRKVKSKGKTYFSTDIKIILENYKRYVYNDRDNPPTRKYERHTEHWGVRGHWRTYKSGKKIWIEPGTRGDKTKKLNQQIYV